MLEFSQLLHSLSCYSSRKDKGSLNMPENSCPFHGDMILSTEETSRSYLGEAS